MSGKNINFGDKKIKKSIFYKNKTINNIENINVNNILVSKKEPYGNENSFDHTVIKTRKNFNGYNDNDVIRPLCIKHPQITGYARKFDENATMSFIVKDKKLFKKYTKIWETMEGLMKINFKSKPVYGDDDKYLKTKIKTYAGSIITIFIKRKWPKKKHHVNVYR